MTRLESGPKTTTNMTCHLDFQLINYIFVNIALTTFPFADWPFMFDTQLMDSSRTIPVTRICFISTISLLLSRFDVLTGIQTVGLI